MTNATSESSDRDERLVALIDRMTVRLRAGDWPSVDEIGREHPDLVDEFRSLWAAVLVAEGVGAASNGNGAAVSSSQAGEAGTLDLPGGSDRSPGSSLSGDDARRGPPLP